jgi:predicted nucleic acid-binding protein
MSKVYIDTSALAKWYVREPFSDEFDNFIRASGEPIISRLTIVEFRCLLARRRRAGGLSTKNEGDAMDTFEEDIRLGFLRVDSMQDRHFALAHDLIEKLPDISLRTLDALHLAIASSSGYPRFATADKVQAEAAETLGLHTEKFFSP